MSATNHTANYSLSQFAQTDKPAWLGDYNQDMTKIDTAMKNNADSVSTVSTTVAGHTSAISANTADIATAQGDINSLTSRVTAVETKNTEQDTAITNAQNKADQADGKADTNATNIQTNATDIANLQTDVASQGSAIATNTSNISSVTSDLATFKNKFDISNVTRTTTPIVSQSAYTSINLAQSDDSSLFKFYGRVTFDNNTGSAISVARTAVTGLSGYYGFRTPLQLTVPPTESYVIDDGALFIPKYPSGNAVNFEVQTSAIAVDTSGYIWINVTTGNTLSIPAYNHFTHYFSPCIYFNTDFGDEPSA